MDTVDHLVTGLLKVKHSHGKTISRGTLYSGLKDTTTNQIFPILSNTQIEHLAQKFTFHHWRKINENHSAIRLITSWATPSENVEALVREIGQL